MEPTFHTLTSASCSLLAGWRNSRGIECNKWPDKPSAVSLCLSTEHFLYGQINDNKELARPRCKYANLTPQLELRVQNSSVSLETNLAFGSQVVWPGKARTPPAPL